MQACAPPRPSRRRVDLGLGSGAVSDDPPGPTGGTHSRPCVITPLLMLSLDLQGTPKELRKHARAITGTNRTTWRGGGREKGGRSRHGGGGGGDWQRGQAGAGRGRRGWTGRRGWLASGQPARAQAAEVRRRERGRGGWSGCAAVCASAERHERGGAGRGGRRVAPSREGQAASEAGGTTAARARHRRAGQC